MKISFFEQCKLPTTTAQQKRHSKGFAYDTTQIKYARALFQAIFEKHKPGKPLDGALVLKLELHYPHTIKTAKEATKYGCARIPKTTAPDWDNIPKIPCDAMFKAGFVANDARIFDGQCKKWHCDIEGVDVLIYTYDYKKGETL